MLAFPNGFDYCNVDSKTFNCNICSTYCANLTKIDPVNPDITRAKPTPLLTKRQKLAFYTKYLFMIATTCSELVEKCMLIIKLK